MAIRTIASTGAPFADTNVGATIGTVPAAHASAITVPIQLTDGTGADLAEAAVVHVYLSVAADGLAIHGTAADGGIAAGTDGALLNTELAGLMATFVSEADGDLDVLITHAADAQDYYLNVILPNGTIVTSTKVEIT